MSSSRSWHARWLEEQRQRLAAEAETARVRELLRRVTAELDAVPDPSLRTLELLAEAKKSA